MEQKNYPTLYNQNNYGAAHLGNSQVDTIQSGGCFDCSFAMKACYYGHRVDPLQLNQLFIDKGVYVSAPGHPDRDLLSDSALAQVFPDVKYIKTFDYEPIPTDMNNIKVLLADPATTLTVRINFGSGNMHFVEAVACDGFVLHIANPISGKIEDFSQRYGDPVKANLHVLVYSGPVPTPPSPVPDTGAAMRFGQAINKSNNFDTVSEYLGIPPEVRVTLGAGQIVVEKIKALQSEIEMFRKSVDVVQKVVDSQPAPVPPSAVTTPPPVVSPPVAAGPTFANGKDPLSSTPPSSVPIPAPATISPVTQVEYSSIKRFIVSLARILFF